MVAGLATNFFFGLLRAAIIVALYGDQQEVAGITLQGAIVYTGVTQAVIAYLSIFGWWDLMNSVHNGEVSADLLKPMNYFTFWMAQDLGRAAVSLLLRGLIIMVLYALVFDLTYPTSLGQWLAFSLTVILSWGVSFGFRFLVNLTAFWTPNAKGIGRFAFAFAWFFSGFLMPIRFFPDWVQQIAYLTPFPHLLNTVVEVYLGVLQGTALWLALLNQLFWIMILVVLSQLVLKSAVRRLVILGG
jgi:ABC-2 type transport system permease protein